MAGYRVKFTCAFLKEQCACALLPLRPFHIYSEPICGVDIIYKCSQESDTCSDQWHLLLNHCVPTINDTLGLILSAYPPGITRGSEQFHLMLLQFITCTSCWYNFRLPDVSGAPRPGCRWQTPASWRARCCVLRPRCQRCPLALYANTTPESNHYVS